MEKEKNKPDVINCESDLEVRGNSDETEDADMDQDTEEFPDAADLPENEKKNGDMAEEVERLTEKVERLTKESKDNYDDYLRKTADLENYKKRLIRERSESAKFANEDLIKSMLPILDNLNRAINAAENGTDFNSLLEGVKMTWDQFLTTLEKEEIKEIKSTGEPFDPSKHDAIRIIESSDHPENVVIEEYEKGYSLHGRVIRPAKVGVTKLKTPNEMPEEEAEV